MTNECMGAVDLIHFLQTYDFVIRMINAEYLQAIANNGAGKSFYWLYDSVKNVWCIL